jgi:hypothetical protein
MWHVWKTVGGAYRIWWGDIREREHLVDLDLDGKIIVTWILKMCGGAGRGFIWLRRGQDRWRVHVSTVIKYLVS